MVILLFTIFHHFSDVSYGSRYTLDDVVQSMKKTGVGLKGRSCETVSLWYLKGSKPAEAKTTVLFVVVFLFFQIKRLDQLTFTDSYFQVH